MRVIVSLMFESIIKIEKHKSGNQRYFKPRGISIMPNNGSYGIFKTDSLNKKWYEWVKEETNGRYNGFTTRY